MSAASEYAIAVMRASRFSNVEQADDSQLREEAFFRVGMVCPSPAELVSVATLAMLPTGLASRAVPSQWDEPDATPPRPLVACEVCLKPGAVPIPFGDVSVDLCQDCRP